MLVALALAFFAALSAGQEPGSPQPTSPPTSQASVPPTPQPESALKPEATVQPSPANAETKPAAPRVKKVVRKPKPKAGATPSNEPRKIVVRKGGAGEPASQIVTSMSAEEASARRQETEKLMSAADEDLKRVLGRTLDAQQQETVAQIHDYLGRARSALDEGDLSRGRTLATKANLLADDLLKH